MADIASPHDRFFRRMLSGPTTAQTFLRRFLPNPVVATLDLESLELRPESFVDVQLRLHISDLVYRTRLREGGEAYVYILLEHKSEPDRLVALQLLRYLLKLWHHVLRQGRKLPLPPVIPLVFYHGRRRWDVSAEFSDLVRLPQELNRYSPKFEYALVDLTVESEENLRDDPILAVTVLVLRHAFSRELKKRLPSILAVLESVLVTPEGAEALDSVLYYVSNIGVEERELLEALTDAFPGRGETIMPMWLEKYIEEGVDRGLQQGLQQGLQRGSVSTAQMFLLDVLEARFGGDATPLHERIRATDDVAVLSELVKAATIAESLEDFCVTFTEVLES